MSPSTPGASEPPAGAAIRPATASDLPELVRLERASFDDPWSEALLAGQLASSSLLVLAEMAEMAEMAGEAGPENGTLAVGYASFLEAVGEAELLRVAVEPEARRRGVGRLLVEAGLAHLGRRGVTRCHLEVRPDNEAALALYRRLGFQVTGRRPGYYPDGSPALLLTLEVG